MEVPLCFLLLLSFVAVDQIFGQQCRLLGSENTCFNCLLQPGCGFCDHYNGPSACYPKGPNGLPNITDCDTVSEPGDQWYGSPGACEDGCNSHDNGKCFECVQDPRCGWCNGGGGCRSGTIEGAWSPTFHGCNGSNWRFYAGTGFSLSNVCSRYAPCTSYIGCFQCVGNFQGLGQTCVYCLSANQTDQTQACFPATSNFTCSSVGLEDLTAVTSKTQCPAQPIASDAQKYVVMLFGSLVVFVVLTLL